MQSHGPMHVIDRIKVERYGPGRYALTFPDGFRIVLEDSADDRMVIDAMAEVRERRHLDTLDAQLTPPGYELPALALVSES